MLPRGLSLYLDLWRWVASWTVVLCHLWLINALEPNLSALAFFATWGHEAVIVFFVLSGFIIQHAAATSDHTLQQFLASRLARIYSVVIPCIALTVIFDQIGQRVAPDIYAKMMIEEAQSVPLARVIVSIALINQCWLNLQMFSNLPYWSICYEFWYYVMFAVFYYRTGATRLALVVLVALIAGPRILPLLPVWLMGGAVYRLRIQVKWSSAVAWFAFAQLFFVLFVYAYVDLLGLSKDWSVAVGAYVWGAAAEPSSLLADYVLAASLALHLIAAKRLDSALLFSLDWCKWLIRAMAGRSFTLYMMHMPLMYLLCAITVAYVDSPLRAWFLVVATIGIPLALASLCENQRHRLKPVMRRLVERYWPSGSNHGERGIVAATGMR
jgi:peptidoglycan/LPS O-acetylase OafA/YrhL